MTEPKELARVLKVLSVETRVRIVQLLKGRALCVNALATRLDVTQGAVSQHLRVMRDADLVIDEKRGYFVHYRLNEQTLAAWREQIDKLLDPVLKTNTDQKGTPKCAGACRKKGNHMAANSRKNLRDKPQD
jgi:DNA-binding transcriptional ArsR family regulator